MLLSLHNGNDSAILVGGNSDLEDVMAQHFFDEGACEDCGALQSTKTTTCEQYRAGKHCPSCQCSNNEDCVVTFPNGKEFHLSRYEMCELLLAGEEPSHSLERTQKTGVGEIIQSMREKAKAMLGVLPISDSY